MFRLKRAVNAIVQDELSELVVRFRAQHPGCLRTEKNVGQIHRAEAIRNRADIPQNLEDRLPMHALDGH